MDLETFCFKRDRQLARLVSEDDGETWRIAELDDEGRDDLVWDSLFAPPDAEPDAERVQASKTFS